MRKNLTLRFRTEKRCPTCGLTKPVSEFFRATRNSDGRSAYCKPCKMARKRKLAAAGKVTPGAEGRFWSRVEKTEGCWFWRGGITTEGYGRFYHGGKDVPSHHMPLIFAGITPPKYPMVCDHTCKTRNCVNPAHIRIVHQRLNTLENSNSVYAKNAAKKQCKNGHALSGDNLAVYTCKDGSRQRICLTCRPHYWRWAVVPRQHPPGVRRLKRDAALPR